MLTLKMSIVSQIEDTNYVTLLIHNCQNFSIYSEALLRKLSHIVKKHAPTMRRNSQLSDDTSV